MDTSLNDTLAALARDIRSESSTTATVDLICSEAVAIVGGATAAGVSMARRKRSVENLGATNEMARRGDALQSELKQGPCLDALWDHEQVHSGDLATDDRWPDWGKRMSTEFGLQSMLCARLFTHQDTVGALNLYATGRYAFDRDALDAARLIAAHAAVAVAAAQQIETLELAVDHRTTTGKAIGIVMERFNLSDEQALGVLRRLSSHSNRKLFDISAELVATGQLPATRH